LLVLLATVAALVLVAAGILAVQATLPDVDELARRAPCRTALMRQREAEARRAGRRYRVDQRWVPYDRVSPLLRRAVLTAEDDAFYSHGGLDWNELQAAARKNLEKRRVVRGGSTITQQLAKNLYLGTDRSLARKLKEVLLAFRLERALTKRRIFELYLNLIEWGPGIYGAEAAAQRHFGVSAAELDARQALLLAAVIINPIRYSAREPSRRIERRVRLIATRMRRRGYLTEEQYAQVLGRALPPRPPWWQFWVGSPETTTAKPFEAAPESLATGADTSGPGPPE
jgi:monofunctional biosynthetic peptidoglycan transglycosylase